MICVIEVTMACAKGLVAICNELVVVAGLALTFKITLIQAAISQFVIKWGKFCNLVHSVCDNTANCV